MPRVLVFCVLALIATIGPLAAADPDEAPLFRPFDPGPLAPPEVRLLEAALAATGDYAGPLDGKWQASGRAALAAYAAREFGGPPLNAHVAAAVTGLVDAIGADGWRESALPGLGLALALPLDRLDAAEPEDGGERRWTTDGALTLLTHRFDDAEVDRWHAAAVAADADPAALRREREADRRVTAGTLRDGRAFYTRSDRIGGAWSTVYLAADASALGALRLAAASLHPGAAEPWDLPEGGVLTRLLVATAALIGSEPTAAAPTASATLASDYGAAIAATPALAERDDAAVASTGSGFYLGPRVVVTADHVVAGCASLSLADGTPVELVAADPALDVAALRTPRPARRWLSLADGTLRLGQRVHAAGFPYYSIAGTSLNLTGGNVSALAGVDDDRRFFSFTAPVQPGNSGGPLIDARGAVLGLVVARLSEDYIVEATGSLPQNVNYALREAELARFLADAGLAAAAAGIPRFDLDEGVPAGFESAIVPIVCH